MKKEYFYIALAALLLPILVRAFWFYRGAADRPEIATPDFASFSAPEAPVNVSETDEEIPQLDGTVLIDTFHGNQFSMTEIASLTSAIQARGGKVEIAGDSFSLESQLKYAGAFVSISPSFTFSTYDVQLLQNFAGRGGKILVFTDATRNFIAFDFISGNPTALGDANAANSLLKVFDISINNDYLYNTQVNEGNFRNVFFDEFGKSELTFGLKEIALYGAHSVQTASGLILLESSESNRSSINDAHNPNQGGAVLNSEGNVVAFGDFTFLSSPYNTYTDNGTLISNLADFALAGEQSATLQNYPYVFNGNTLSVYLAPDLTKNTDMITALSGLQSAYRFQNIKLEFVDKIPTSGDAIIISSFLMDEDTQAIANKFDIEISDTISTVEFGNVNSGGMGALLLDATTRGNKLVLLAGTPEDVIALMGVVSSSNINSCLTSDRVAMCSVGFGGDDFFSEDEFFFEDPLFEETPTDGAFPEATPTPGG